MLTPLSMAIVKTIVSRCYSQIIRNNSSLITSPVYGYGRYLHERRASRNLKSEENQVTVIPK